MTAEAVNGQCASFANPADWPSEVVYVGEEAVHAFEGAARVAHPGVDLRDQVSAALMVAELHLARGGSDGIVESVYDAHAWILDGGSDEDGELLLAELRAYDDARCP